MITSLDELIAFTVDEARRRPAIAKKILLQTPGCSEEDIRELRHFEPDLPPSYVKCITRISLRGTNLPGFFRLCPGVTSGRGSFVDDFKSANSLDLYHQQEFSNFGMLRVASWNDGDICIAKNGSGSWNADSVFRFDDLGKNESPILIGANFERFLICAGNVAEILLRDFEIAAELQIEMLVDRLSLIGLTTVEISNWYDIARTIYYTT